MLLESGEDVDQKDQVLVFPGLCESNVSSVAYEQALVFGFALAFKLAGIRSKNLHQSLWVLHALCSWTNTAFLLGQ